MAYLNSQVASMVVDRSTSDFFLSQRFGGMMPPFLVLFLNFIVHTFLISHSYIAFIRRRYSFPSPHPQPPWNAEPRLELGPALQVANALQLSCAALTELRRTY